MLALREALREEFFDVTVELPREYGAILPAPPMRAPVKTREAFMATNVVARSDAP